MALYKKDRILRDLLEIAGFLVKSGEAGQEFISHRPGHFEL
jgi:hypothetical protein